MELSVARLGSYGGVGVLELFGRLSLPPTIASTGTPKYATAWSAPLQCGEGAAVSA